jgi:hypothetical protein
MPLSRPARAASANCPSPDTQHRRALLPPRTALRPLSPPPPPPPGPSTVAGMAAAKGWGRSLVPAVLVSSLGYALGSFIGMGLGAGVLRPLCRTAGG